MSSAVRIANLIIVFVLLTLPACSDHRHVPPAGPSISPLYVSSDFQGANKITGGVNQKYGENKCFYAQGGTGSYQWDIKLGSQTIDGGKQKSSCFAPSIAIRNLLVSEKYTISVTSGTAVVHIDVTVS
ncbi:hypothetical protein KW791_04125 [Candidatus Parcubacteria bacterium]|nr:hypothetical protein [Candidatus Parcubacteria bacterium]